MIPTALVYALLHDAHRVGVDSAYAARRTVRVTEPARRGRPIRRRRTRPEAT